MATTACSIERFSTTNSAQEEAELQLHKSSKGEREESPPSLIGVHLLKIDHVLSRSGHAVQELDLEADAASGQVKR